MLPARRSGRGGWVASTWPGSPSRSVPRDGSDRDPVRRSPTHRPGRVSCSRSADTITPPHSGELHSFRPVSLSFSCLFSSPTRFHFKTLHYGNLEAFQDMPLSRRRLRPAVCPDEANREFPRVSSRRAGSRCQRRGFTRDSPGFRVPGNIPKSLFLLKRGSAPTGKPPSLGISQLCE